MARVSPSFFFLSGYRVHGHRGEMNRRVIGAIREKSRGILGNFILNPGMDFESIEKTRE